MGNCVYSWGGEKKPRAKCGTSLVFSCVRRCSIFVLNYKSSCFRSGFWFFLNKREFCEQVHWGKFGYRCVYEVLQGILCLKTMWKGKKTLPLSALLDSSAAPPLSRPGQILWSYSVASVDLYLHWHIHSLAHAFILTQTRFLSLRVVDTAGRKTNRWSKWPKPWLWLPIAPLPFCWPPLRWRTVLSEWPEHVLRNCVCELSFFKYFINIHIFRGSGEEGM